MTSTEQLIATLDQEALLDKVRRMYRAVAESPDERFHFETGRELAERLGYPASALDAVPSGAVESFAGVGYFLDLAALRPGDSVLDLGAGSGMDAFVAAQHVGDDGRVVGIDVTPEQLDKADRLRADNGIENVEFRAARIEDLPFDDDTFDAVISNGVINLVPDKDRAFAEAARVLRPGGRLALADIVTELPLTEAIVCDVDLWASCIGGAPQQDAYAAAIGRAGLTVESMRENAYEFLSDQARGASRKYGVRSVSVLARMPG